MNLYSNFVDDKTTTRIVRHILSPIHFTSVDSPVRAQVDAIGEQVCPWWTVQSHFRFPVQQSNKFNGSGIG